MMTQIMLAQYEIGDDAKSYDRGNSYQKYEKKRLTYRE